MRMSKIQLRDVGQMLAWVMLMGMSVMQCNDWGRDREMNRKLEEIEWKAGELIDKVEQDREEVKRRDSVLLGEIGKSEERMESWMKLRAESWMKAGRYMDSVKVERSKRDSLLKGNRFLEW
jgi:hypothetical protein